MAALIAWLALECGVQELPPLEAYHRFGPCSWTSCQAVARAVGCEIEVLERRLELECVQYERLRMEEALDIYRLRKQAWELLGTACDPDFSEGYRRQCLNELRELLGWEAFYQGKMP
jgi:hypothetical protein